MGCVAVGVTGETAGVVANGAGGCNDAFDDRATETIFHTTPVVTTAALNAAPIKTGQRMGCFEACDCGEPLGVWLPQADWVAFAGSERAGCERIGVDARRAPEGRHDPAFIESSPATSVLTADLAAGSSRSSTSTKAA